MSIRSELKEVIRERLGLFRELASYSSPPRTAQQNPSPIRIRRKTGFRRRTWLYDFYENETETERARRLMKNHSQPKKNGRKKR